MQISELINAWEYWDDAPGNDRTTNSRESLCQELAADIGVTATTLHELIVYNRREGRTAQEAILRAYDKLTAAIRGGVTGNTSPSGGE